MEANDAILGSMNAVAAAGVDAGVTVGRGGVGNLAPLPLQPEHSSSSEPQPHNILFKLHRGREH